jgi:hypothetical protein
MTDININDIHYKRYLKYKSKYLELKQSGSGGSSRSSRSSGSSPHTVETLKYIKKNLLFGTGFQWYKEINFDFDQIIDDLKTDLTNKNSNFKLASLDAFVKSPIYTRIIFDIVEKELGSIVNLKTNFISISNISSYGHMTLINKDKIKSINTFIKEIKDQFNNPSNLNGMEYRKEFQDILTIFLGRYEKYYNEHLKEFDK